MDVNLPPSYTVRILNRLLLFIIIGNIIYIFVSFPSLPDEIPIHFNLAGEADNWGNKAIILIFPLLFKVVFLLLYFLAKDPSTYNYPVKVTEENAESLFVLARQMLTVMNFQVGVIMLFLTFYMIQTAKGVELPGFLLIVLITIVLGTTIYYLIKMLKLK